MNYARDGNGLTQGTDECFNNRNDKYISDLEDENFNRDLPWTPYYNCYTSREGGTLTSLSFADCHEQSMQLFIMVEDPIENQSELTLPWPMRGEALYLKASIHEIKNLINVFPTDIMRIDFYITKGGEGKP